MEGEVSEVHLGPSLQNPLLQPADLEQNLFPRKDSQESSDEAQINNDLNIVREETPPNNLEIKVDGESYTTRFKGSLSFQGHRNADHFGIISEFMKPRRSEYSWKAKAALEGIHKGTDDISVEKKCAFCQICHLGLTRDQVIEALQYIEGLSSDLEWTEMFQLTLNRLDICRQGSDSVASVELETSTQITEITEITEDLKIPQETPNIKDIHVEVKNEAMCEICFEVIEKNQIKQPLSCDHRFCNSCYVDYFNEKISTNDVLDIRCPYNTCSCKFSDEQIKAIIPAEKYETYLKFKTNKILSQNPNLRWCIRPGCKRYMIGKEGCVKLVCKCGAQICFICRNEYHPLKNCEQMLDDTYKQYLVKYDIQKCPRCKSGVEKNDGCNHMTCCVCYYQWCWLCGGKYSKMHYSILNPFGCGTLQDGTHTRSHWPWWKIYLLRLVKMILLILCVTMLPLIWIFFSILTPNIIFNKMGRGRGRRRFRKGLGKKIMACLLIVVGVVFLPLCMLCTLAAGIIFIVEKLN